MGALLVDSGTKGFTALNAIALQNAQSINSNADDVASPALGKVLDMLKDHANSDGEPTEVMMLIRGKGGEHAFTFVLKNPSELMEVLQWTVGRE